jgi:hypothetical protein
VFETTSKKKGAAAGRSSLETNENDEKRVSALPLATEESTGQVVCVLACGRALPGRVPVQRLKHKHTKVDLSAKTTGNQSEVLELLVLSGETLV